MKTARPVPRLRRYAAAAALSALLGLAAGCQSLLPDAATHTDVEWRSYEEAQRAIESIEPYRTTKQDLLAMGLDPGKNAAITILSYSEILQRFAAGSALRPEDYDRGIRDCLLAGKACVAYSLQIRRVRKERVGNFWLDSLNFRRETDITGWSFNALLILVNDTVVFTLHGGQPRIHEQERVRNPLGPLQGWGDQVPNFVR
ncbi:hypothetical protein [Quisquiliibacterium transsilvanicum]|uniref:DUF4823 domain-containing protein n=1 Tax=Quisquiliibacterium transsilvanicum TaxID=1549638 RepID=A0A7W8M960_9BURK|nr:hypothetical protein [Quisquiliibacterium transsilvanicum]MBB5271975.1 hypothetical protein [Quisquiliibacterium transsilvanicum]